MYLKIHAAVFLSCLFHFEAIKALNPCHAVRNKCHLTVHWLQGTHAGAGPGGDAADQPPKASTAGGRPPGAEMLGTEGEGLVPPPPSRRALPLRAFALMVLVR